MSNGISFLLIIIEEAFAKDCILKILREFIFYPDDSSTYEETATPQFYLVIRSIIYKHIKGDASDIEVMNSAVEGI